MANFLQALGAGFQGQQDYQTFLQNQAKEDQLAKMRDMEMLAYQRKLDDDLRQQNVGAQGNKAFMDVLSQLYGNQPAQMPPMPQGASSQPAQVAPQTSAPP